MQRHGDPRFYKLLDEIGQIHSDKNHDYAISGDPFSNFRKCEAFGIAAWKGVLTRMSDKWSRLEQLASGKSPKNESIRDTLIDLSVYSLVCLLLLEDATPASYDDARAEPRECRCGRLVTRPEACTGLPCPYERDVSGHPMRVDVGA